MLAAAFEPVGVVLADAARRRGARAARVRGLRAAPGLAARACSSASPSPTSCMCWMRVGRHRRLARACARWRRRSSCRWASGSRWCTRLPRLAGLGGAVVGRRSRRCAAACPSAACRWGRLAFATADTPWADALPWVGDDRRQPPARPDRHDARLAACSHAARRTRRTASPSSPGSAVVTVAPVAGAVRTSTSPARRRSPPCRATCPGDGDDILLDHRAGHPQPRATRPSSSPTGVAAGRASRARLRGVAGELHRRRPVPRRRASTPGSATAVDADRRADPGRRDGRRPAPSTCSTRASSATRHRAAATATPSGTRCRTASTSRSAAA